MHSPLLNRALGLAAAIVSFVLIVPFRPSMPTLGLDPSWRTALNEATAKGMVFGRDMIFTLGPLASVYTRQYHPATEGIMLIGSALLAIGALAGFWLLCRPGRGAMLVLFPMAMALCTSRGALFMMVPFLLLLAAAHEGDDKPTPPIYVAYAGLAIAVGILPLTKGSFSAVAGAEALLAVILLATSGRRDLAVLTAVVSASSLVLAWALVGQPLAALPGFFIAQAPMISGYTGAVSVDSQFWVVAWFLGVAGILWLFMAYWLRDAPRRRAALVLIGSAFYLFVSFKAGFVRHDGGHADVAAGTLILGGAALACAMGGRLAVAVFVIGLTGWFVIDGTLSAAPAERPYTRAPKVIAGAVSAGASRFGGADELVRRYERAKASIRFNAPFRVAPGSVDVYPTELAPIFAADAAWAARPVPQSHMAYTRSLLEANAKHLEGPNAPENVYLAILAIDRRLPSQDDSLSWPALLTRYDVARFDGQYVQLTRGARRPKLFGPEQKRAAGSGQVIALPEEPATLWVSVDVQPSFWGKMALALYKLPEVTIELTLANGRVLQHRLIPDIARHGFLLSPYVESSRDFVLVAIGDVSKRVASFRVITPRPTLWASIIGTSIRRLEVEPQLQAIRTIGVPPSPPNSLPVAVAVPDCFIDGIEGTAGRLVRVFGWIAPAARAGQAPESVSLTLDGNQRMHYAVPLVQRPDVGVAFGHPAMTRVGFDALLDASALSGPVRASVSSTAGGKTYRCQMTRSLD